MTTKRNIEIVRGSTFSLQIFWETLPIVYKAITNIEQTAPVRITAPSHGAVEGARGAVTAVTGMREINAADPNDLHKSDYHRMTVINANTVEFNDVNAAAFRAYVSGGYLQYYTPVDLTGFSARMSLRRRCGLATLLECSVGGVSGDTKPAAAGTDGTAVWVPTSSGTPDQEWLPGHAYSQGDVVDLKEILRATQDNSRIDIDTLAHTITVLLSATDTATIAATNNAGVFDLEMVSPDITPVVTKILAGQFAVLDEATMT